MCWQNKVKWGRAPLATGELADSSLSHKPIEKRRATMCKRRAAHPFVEAVLAAGDDVVHIPVEPACDGIALEGIAARNALFAGVVPNGAGEHLQAAVNDGGFCLVNLCPRAIRAVGGQRRNANKPFLQTVKTVDRRPVAVDDLLDGLGIVFAPVPDGSGQMRFGCVVRHI